MRGLEKNYMKRGHIYIYIHIYIDGHRDSMKESAKGRFFEKSYIRKGKYRPATPTAADAPSSRSGYPPLDSEMGWTGELWSKTNLLNWQN